MARHHSSVYREWSLRSLGADRKCPLNSSNRDLLEEVRADCERFTTSGVLDCHLWDASMTFQMANTILKRSPLRPVKRSKPIEQSEARLVSYAWPEMFVGKHVALVATMLIGLTLTWISLLRLLDLIQPVHALR